MVLQAIVMGVAQHQVRDLIAVQMAMVKCVLPGAPEFRFARANYPERALLPRLME